MDGWSDLQLGRSTHREFSRSVMISRSEICLCSRYVLQSKGRGKAGNSLLLAGFISFDEIRSLLREEKNGNDIALSFVYYLWLL
jgi:hypothetical protein